VDAALLGQAAQGIAATIGELRAVGLGAGAAEAGRGFSGLELTGTQLGHGGLRVAFTGFCERWSWGVRALVADGDEFARRLHLAAGTYHDMETYAAGTFKDALNAAVGDPRATPDTVEHESVQRIASRAGSHDYSTASWTTAGHDIAGTWRAEADDLAHGPLGIAARLAGDLGAGQR